MPEILKLLTPTNIIIFILVLTRLSGMFSSAPFFSTFNMPRQIKVLFACSVAFIIYPMVAAKGGFVVPTSMPQLFVLLCFEFAIGFLIGFVANIVFYGVRIAGSLLSIQMSLSMSEILDPATGESSPIVSNIYIYLATMVFFAINAHNWLFESVYYSFSAMPMGSFAVFEGPVVANVIMLSAQMFKIAFGIAMPIVAIMLTCDILLGMMAKMMPQMNIFMVSIPIKVGVGITLILVFLAATAGYMQDVMGEFIRNIIEIFT